MEGFVLEVAVPLVPAGSTGCRQGARLDRPEGREHGSDVLVGKVLRWEFIKERVKEKKKENYHNILKVRYVAIQCCYRSID